MTHPEDMVAVATGRQGDGEWVVVDCRSSFEIEADAILAATPPAVRADVAIDELLDDDDFRVPGELHYRSTRL